MVKLKSRPLEKFQRREPAMRHFCKLNLISALYACIFVMISEYLMNAYRISEATESGGGPGEQTFKILLWGAFCILSVACIILVHAWMKNRPSVFWAALLWFPYALLLIWLIGHLGPERHPADSGNYAAGLIILLMAVGYPFFVGLATLIGFAWPSRIRSSDATAPKQSP